MESLQQGEVCVLDIGSNNIILVLDCSLFIKLVPEELVPALVKHLTEANNMTKGGVIKPELWLQALSPRIVGYSSSQFSQKRSRPRFNAPPQCILSKQGPPDIYFFGRRSPAKKSEHLIDDVGGRIHASC